VRGEGGDKIRGGGKRRKSIKGKKRRRGEEYSII